MSSISIRLFTVVALALAVGLATGLSPYASASPDGLERVAEQQGLLDRGRPAALQSRSPVPGYAFPGIGDPRLATAAAGFVGTLGVFGLGFAIAVRLRS